MSAAPMSESALARRGGRPIGRGLIVLLSVAAVAATGSLAGCVQSSAGSRHTLYDDIDGLAADSSSIVVGTPSEQSDDDGTTVSSFDVTNTPANPQLGGNLADRGNPISVGDTIKVRQDTPPFLEAGSEYLLFLTPTMLGGDAENQFYITGANAGIYLRDGDQFRRVAVDSGDTLPDTFSLTGDQTE